MGGNGIGGMLGVVARWGVRRHGVLGVMGWWGAQTWDPWGAWCHGVVGTEGTWGL